jgi:hypothetical protein
MNTTISIIIVYTLVWLIYLCGFFVLLFTLITLMWAATPPRQREVILIKLDRAWGEKEKNPD